MTVGPVKQSFLHSQDLSSNIFNELYHKLDDEHVVVLPIYLQELESRQILNENTLRLVNQAIRTLTKESGFRTIQLGSAIANFKGKYDSYVGPMDPRAIKLLYKHNSELERYVLRNVHSNTESDGNCNIKRTMDISEVFEE